MFKNIASQQIAVFAYDADAKLPKTGDAANITAKISKDGGATAATNDVNPTELSSTDAKGIYIFDLTQAESNANLIVLSAVSATENITLEPVIIYTQTVMVGTNGAVTSLTAITDHTADYKATSVTVSDKTGFSLSTPGILAIWHQLLSAVVTADTIGKKIKDWVVGQVKGIDTDIITAASVNADAVTKLQSGLATADQLSDVQAKTDDIPLHPASTENVAENKVVIDATNIIIGTLNDLSSADILAATGITAGGTLTVAEAIKILLAIAAGQVQDKAGVSGTYQVLDAEDGTTVIAEITPSETTPQLTVNI